MGRDDWYRNTDWTEEIEAAFYVRLKRARDKLQYLSLQAWHLIEKHPDVALKLADEFFALLAKSGDAVGRIFVVNVHNTRAKAFAKLGEIDAAIAAYEDAIAREREFPNMRTMAYLDFAMLIVETKRKDLFPRALAILDERRDWAAFPISRYQACGIEAILLYALDRKGEARASALKAVEAASEVHSGFRKHPKLGLVADTDDEFGTRVQAIARGN